MSSTTIAPKDSHFRRLYGRYMLVVGLGGNLLFYLQALEIFRTRSAGDVSLPAFVIAFWAVSSWLGYGLLRRDVIIIAANIAAVIGSGLVILGKLLYG
jgi:MtN3 and saliva related transmembrane protein